MPEDAESFLGVASSQSAGATSETPPPFEAATTSPYYGYGGWLKFFCVVQMYVAPLLAVLAIGVSIFALGDAAERFPGLVFVAFVEGIGDLGLVATGVYAGYVLSQLRPGAVRVVKRFLLAALVWSLFGFVLPFMGGDLPSQVSEAMMVEAGKAAVRTLISFTIWFSYFNVSKRVKATFPQG
jgi:hypothetical protein